MDSMNNTDRDVIREVFRTMLADEKYSMYFYALKDDYRVNQPLKLYTVKLYPSLIQVSQNRKGHICTIVAPTKLCPHHSQECGCRDSNCTMFHLCKFFMLSGSCKNRNCRYGHSLKTDHNKKLLSSMCLDDPDIQVHQLRILFQRLSNRTRASIPLPCNHFNWKGSCNRGDKCTNLHICKHLLLGNCKYGERCDRNHDISEDDVEHVLDRFGLELHDDEDFDSDDDSYISDDDDSKLQILILLYQEHGITDTYLKGREKAKDDKQILLSASAVSIPDLSEQSTSLLNKKERNKKKETKGNEPKESSSRQKKPEICLHYVRGSCRYNERCYKLHVRTTYQWQWIPFRSLTQEWENLSESDNLTLEQSYCDLKETAQLNLNRSLGVTTVNLNFIDKNDLKIRRVATINVSQCTSLYDEPWATKWLWYFMDNRGTWIEYGKMDTVGHIATVNSSDIEAAYQQNINGTFHFSSEDRGNNHGGQNYKIEFDRMKQTNLQYGTVRGIKRRPEFTDRNVIQLRKLECDKKKHSQKLNLPLNWSKPLNGDIYSHYQVVELQSTSEEYLSIKKGLSNGSVSNILSIKRIENMELWKAFCQEKEFMDRKLKRDVKIDRLYHGTESSITEAICRQGFDCRLSGSRVGHRYGKGSYFGKTADVSSNYCDKSCLMFVVKALVGDYTRGCKDYPRPPLKNPSDPSSHLYDSCVDNMASPSMFVIFNNRQVYPEYLIQFKTQNHHITQSASPQTKISTGTNNIQTAPVRKKQMITNTAATIPRISTGYHVTQSPSPQTKISTNTNTIQTAPVIKKHMITNIVPAKPTFRTGHHVTQSPSTQNQISTSINTTPKSTSSGSANSGIQFQNLARKKSPAPSPPISFFEKSSVNISANTSSYQPSVTTREYQYQDRTGLKQKNKKSCIIS